MNRLKQATIAAPYGTAEEDVGEGVPEPTAMTIADFCSRYGIGRTSAYYELKAGRLKAKKCGRRTLIPRTFADEWLSSLSNYGQVPRSFVKDLGKTADDGQIVGAIITLADRLGFNVVAEGVETGEQADLLRASQCELLQGYMFRKPVDAAAFSALFKAAT